ncbi:copper transporter [Trueperella bialowiezensis]|uniref:Protein of uncharacterized function (DUF3186) n=1 Tax=Trueperella bialowiezensis TaxID=312285 RepID=A0A3S4X4A0_9ACTO|nr:copper transporter [Trueperella bialowiezensis]VEI12335.1 Protein of uncharacterised function (DUF3186) [Trueperella bialowiezensis]
MVDFRYHLVSLISVFFALAIGIILGAGPLQNSIGNVLQSQVSDLRATNEKLKADNSEVREALARQEQAFEEAAPELLGATLEGQAVGVVALPGVPEAEITAVKSRLEAAGATITGHTLINDSWTAADQNSFRTTFADQLKAYVPDLPDDADANRVLALALNTLVRDGLGAHGTLAGLMTGTATPMITTVDMAQPADAVVILSPEFAEPAHDADADARAQTEYTTTTFVALATDFAERGATVVAGPAKTDHDVVSALRRGGTAVSTADSLNLVLGQINVPIAVATELTDGHVHLGVDEGTQRTLGARVEAKKVAEPAQAEAPAEEAPAEGDGAPPADEAP